MVQGLALLREGSQGQSENGLSKDQGQCTWVKSHTYSSLKVKGPMIKLSKFTELSKLQSQNSETRRQFLQCACEK